MITAQTLYRTTLVAAALASVAAPSVAAAHEREWREHSAERYWQPERTPREFRPRYGLRFRPRFEDGRLCTTPGDWPGA